MHLVLTKDINEIMKEFDFYEGIVSDIKWDSNNLFDLLITVYYFWDDYKNKDLVLRFKNCKKATFSLPLVFESIQKTEIKDHMYSWYTITGMIYELHGKT